MGSKVPPITPTRRRSRPVLELALTNPDGSAGRGPGFLQRAVHADPIQQRLEPLQRGGRGKVRPRDQPLDPGAADFEPPAMLRHAERPRLGPWPQPGYSWYDARGWERRRRHRIGELFDQLRDTLTCQRRDVEDPSPPPLEAPCRVQVDLVHDRERGPPGKGG